MRKLWEILDAAKHVQGWAFWCPACSEYHHFPANGSWTFNGDFESPTFTPSVTTHAHDGKPRCHLTVTSGVIEYQRDSEHRMAGERVPLEAIR